MWPFRKRTPPDDLVAYTANMTVARETRWSREYHNADQSESFLDSRFRDGSASITLDELTRDWPAWTNHEKVDFCQSFIHYQGRQRAKILRFLMCDGNHYVWSVIAASVARTLPIKESLPFLRECCEDCDIGRGANYFQALWLTESPEAVGILWPSLDRIWDSPDLLKPNTFCNLTTFDAIWCIDALVRLDEPVSSLRDRYETLKTHPTMQEDAVKWLSEHFEHKEGN